jgi:ABC-type molybdate transport system substrate-binding protein
MKRSGTLALLLGAFLVLSCGGRKSTVVLLCAEDLRHPVQAAIDDLQQRRGTVVDVTYGSDAELIAKLSSPTGVDIFIPAGEERIPEAERLGVVPSRIEMVTRLVMFVAVRDTALIGRLDDLWKPGIRIGIVEEGRGLLGSMTRDAIAKTGMERRVLGNVVARYKTSEDVVDALLLGELDAGICWHPDMKRFSDLGRFPFLPNHFGPRRILGVLTRQGSQNAVATEFFDVLTTNKGGDFWRAFDFPVPQA